MIVNHKTESERPFKKFIETFTFGDSNEEYEVFTDTGWSDIKAIGKTTEYETWELKTASHTLKAADTHIVFRKNANGLFGEAFLNELIIDDIILTKSGEEHITSIENLGTFENMYDLQLSDDNRRYYTNGILSHNSIWLANIAANSVRLGQNTAVISLEMRDRKVVKRLGANLLTVRMKEYADIANDNDAMKKKLSNIGYDTLKVPGQLFVKEFPTSSAGVPDIEQYLRKMEEMKGIKFKVIVLDYINILKNWRNPNTENMYMKIKQIAEDTRAMAMRNDWAIVTATQINRCLTLDTIVNHETKGDIQISELRENDRILGPDGYTNVTKIYPVEKQKVYLIKTKSGKTIKASGNHLHPVSNNDTQYLTTTELRVGDKLFVKNNDHMIELHEDEILEIIEIGEEETLDISVSNTSRTFFANDILTHNSGFGSTDLNATNISESAALGHTVDAMFGIIQDEIMHANEEYILKLIANRDDGYKNSRKKFLINYEYMRITEDANSQIITE